MTYNQKPNWFYVHWFLESSGKVSMSEPHKKFTLALDISYKIASLMSYSLSALLFYFMEIYTALILGKQCHWIINTGSSFYSKWGVKFSSIKCFTYPTCFIKSNLLTINPVNQSCFLYLVLQPNPSPKLTCQFTFIAMPI